MTLKQIKSMFAPGQQWRVKRIGVPTVVNGNLGRTVLPAENCDEARKVNFVRDYEICWLKTDGSVTYTSFPKAAQVTEAAPGRLCFTYENGVKMDLLQITPA